MLVRCDNGGDVDVGVVEDHHIRAMPTKNKCIGCSSAYVMGLKEFKGVVMVLFENLLFVLSNVLHYGH